LNKYEITTQKKKEAIVNAALSLFTDNGFTHVTIKEIAALAGVSQVSIYNYFGSKDALFCCCAEAVVQDAILKAKAILAGDGDFIDKIKSALSVCSSEFNIVFSNYFSEKALSDRTLFDMLVQNINNSKREIYREYIEYGKREGAIAPSLSTNMIIDFLDALNAAAGNQKFDEDKLSEMQQLYDLVLYGLIGRP